MKLTQTIACTGALLFVPAFASPALAQSHDHNAANQSPPQQSEPAKPQGMPCPMMQSMHGGMKMDGKPMPHSGAQSPATGNGAGSMNGTGEMKCMQGGTAATPVPQAAPGEQHSHDHSRASTPR